MASNDNGSAVDLGEAHHVGAGREVPQVAVLVVFGGADERAGFDEGTRIDEPIDALPDRVAARVVLALDALRASHLAGQGADVLEFGEGIIPGVAGPPTAALFIYGHGHSSSARFLQSAVDWRDPNDALRRAS